jgi:hypothetical protein
MTFRRLVLHFPGFEQTSAAAQFDRIRHSAQKAGEIWNFAFERLTLEQEDGARYAASESMTRGSGWRCHTRIVHFSWNDIIQSYERTGHPQGLLTNFPKFLAFFADGTARRYWRASKRYWGFTIFPLLLIALFMALSSAAAYFLFAMFVDPGIIRIAVSGIAALLLTLVLCKWPGDRMYLLLTINDWGFARDMVNRSNPVIEERYRVFAAMLGDEVAAGDYDEIVVSGHSFGSVWAVAALALALQMNPALLRHRKLTFLALGSSLLKIALAPEAQFMRAWIQRVVEEPNLFWHEIQTKDDIIAFYRADPFAELRIEKPAAEVRIDRVNYKKAMAKKRYRAMRKSFYRTHRQYILYCDIPFAFDYMLRLFGPLTSRDLAMRPDSAQAVALGRSLAN